jgi:hypothetical protein
MRFTSHRVHYGIAAATVTVGMAAMAQVAAAEEPPKPSFAPVIEKTSRQLTACGANCEARDLLFGSNEDLTVVVRRTGPRSEAKPNSPKLVLQGQQNGNVEVVSGTDIVYTPSKGATTQELFTIDLSSITDPNEYSGALLFDPSSGADQVSVPVSLKVREGPVCPLLLLIGTVLLGAGFAFVLSQREAVKFRSDATLLRNRIDALPESERSILRPLWDQMWDGRNDDLALAQSRLTALTRGAEALRECRDAQDEALRSPAAIHLTPWVQRIGNATARLVNAVQSFAATYDDKVALVTQTKEEFATAVRIKGEVDSLARRAKPASGAGATYSDFQAVVKKFEGAINGVPSDASQAAPNLKPLLHEVEGAFAELEKAHGSPLEEVGEGPVAAGVGEAVVALATALGWPAPVGAAEVEAKLTMFDVTTAVGRGLGAVASFGVMLIVLAIGFKVTYLDNLTFGANLTDWLALVFWGLAAYGARKTLTGLGSDPKPSS